MNKIKNPTNPPALNKTALIIQEDIILLKILERLMMVNKYHCKSIRSLEELGIEDQQENFNIIISDILFDGIAPLDFVFQIKEIILHRSLIIVTSMGQQKVREEILSSGNVTGFFAVPIDMHQIQNLLAS